MLFPRPDALIFDMDGTLWDAVDTYAASWNKGLSDLKIDKEMSREDLEFVMGWERQQVLDHLLPDLSKEQQNGAFEHIDEVRRKLIVERGGKLYEGVLEGLKELAEHYQLFIVSNCPKGLIVDFMNWAGITSFITDEMAYGVNMKPKHHNIKLLIDKYSLQQPIYIGDTDTDSKESRLANIPFVFLEEGFGNTEDYDIKFESFTAFAAYFMELALEESQRS